MRIPVATYRLQINDDFSLDDARAIVPYLARFGVSDLYLSPTFEARAGSTHGYDVTDPTRIRASIGGMGALRRLADTVRSHSMGLILDIVPNHMAASIENPWWRDVLTRGSGSPFATFFDIDWGSAAAPRRLRLPILGEPLDQVVRSGQLGVDAASGELVCYETRLPLCAGTGLADDLRAILAQQHYELVHWREASETVSYRRFFDIPDLVGVRVEDDDVFRSTHSLVRELAAAGTITGLRIDHVDGLRDPTAYLQQLRTYVRAPDGTPVYTVVEKILERDERLPDDWQCEGTTGYEFLSLAIGMLIDAAGHRRIDEAYQRMTADQRSFNELVHAKKLLVIDRLFRGELRALATDLEDLLDVDATAAREAIAAVTAGMRVYRTYIRTWQIRAEDRTQIEYATADALKRQPDLAGPLRRLREVLLLAVDPGDADRRASMLDWVMRWQQFTGPVMAKGYEDTALYCHNALIAANDVGTDPSQPAPTVTELHNALSRRAADRPHSLNATATHDTKRGEDTRARIAVISELPDEWRRNLRRWMREGEEWRAELSPDDDETDAGADVDSLLYQTLAGAWPVGDPDEEFLERIKAYMTKAVREAKEQTSWRRPDEDYEQALSAFIDTLMADVGRAGLAEEVAAFATRLAPYGVLNALAQTLLRITAPGVPDIYQGTELWSFSLVDPDNRRPVDFERRRRLLDDVEVLLDAPDPETADRLLSDWTDGRIKLLITAAALRFRLRHRDVYTTGDYIPLRISGARAEHVVGFARRAGGRCCLTAVARLPTRLTGAPTAPRVDPGVWSGTALHVPTELRQDWHNALTGETIADAAELELARVFATLPLALLGASQPIGA